MSIVIDAILVVLFLVFVIIFTKFGFAKTVHKIGKTWLAVFCSVILGPWLAGLLTDLFLREWIVGGVLKTLTSIVEENANGYNLEQLFANLPENFVNFLNHQGISLVELEAQYGSYAEANVEIMNGMAVQIATPCIAMVSTVIGYIVCFVIPRIFFWWIERKVDRSDDHPILAFFDHVSGFVSGAIVGYIAALGVALLIYTGFQVSLAFDTSTGVMTIYEKSYVFKFLNEFDTLGAIGHVIQSLR